MTIETGDGLKRHVLTMRVSDGLLDRIRNAAKAQGRSVSQEIQSRLEMSFRDDTILGSASTSVLTKLVAGALALVEIESDKPWTKDRMTWEAVAAAVQTILISFQPQIDLDIWERHRDELFVFFNAAYELDRIRKIIDGLSRAYPFKDNFPPEIESAFAAAWEDYAPALDRVRDSARQILDGPMREHEERRRRAIAQGRELVVSRSKSKSGNVSLGGVMRMYASSGAFEPLNGLLPNSEEEILDCIRKIAGRADSDPAMDADAFRTTQPSWLEIQRDDYAVDQEA